VALVVEGPGAEPSLIAGRYRLEARLARGGMGTVYHVVDQVTQRPCALKRVVMTAGDERRRARMFEREFHVLAGLKHPRIIEVYDYGKDEQGAYYTMELLDGSDLRELAPLPYTTACRYLRDVASSLALLHARNLLHRDLSPRNIRITSDERAKLIDFGALSSFGRSATIVGTPPFVPPEALDGAELDQRADLYALGALAYWVLTGRHAYDVRAIADLRGAWARQPPAPCEVAARDGNLPPIPRPLDELVLALLSRNPLARPTSAAEVIARLSAIAHLPADSEPLSALSYLHGGEAVGRARERAQLRRRMKAALSGSGSVLMIHAEAGMGSGRILFEVAIEARLHGACAVVVDAAQHRGSYGVAAQVVAALLAAQPDEARAAMAEHEVDLTRLLAAEDGSEREPRAPSTSGRGNVDPREARLRTQRALLDWVDRLTQRTPLVVAVRGFHHVDDSSATWLAALGPRLHERRMLLVLVTDPNETAVAPAAHAALRELATPIHLRGLSRDEVRALVETTFGEIPDTERLVAWLHELTFGKPRACIDLLEHLIEQGVIRFTDGVWALPREIGSHELPADLGEALVLRLSRLSADAHRLASALCVHRGPIPIERALAIAKLERVQVPFRALTELEQHGVLLAGDHNLRFGHATLRDIALAQLGPDESRRLHAQLGALISLERSEDPAALLDAGWHLLHGGEERRGADLLARAGLAMSYDADHLPAAIPALEAALAAYRKQGRSQRELASLLGTLANAGFFADRKVVETHGDAAAAALHDVLGLDLMRQLRPLLGGRLSLLLGLASSLVGYALAVGVRKAMSALREHLILFSTTVLALTGLAAMTLDAQRTRRYARMLAPFKFLGEDHALAVSYRWTAAIAMLPEDRLAETLASVRRVLARIEDPRPIRDMPQPARELMRGFALYASGSLETFLEDPEALQRAAELERMDSKLFEMCANQIRANHHGLRGEEQQAQQFRERVELFAVQAGSSWQAEVWAPCSALLCYMLTGDIVGLQRTARQLERLAEEIPSLRRHAQLAVAAHALVRGDLASARAEAFTITQAVEPRAFVGWSATLAAEIQTLRALGEPEQARQLGERVLALYDAEDRAVTTMITPVVIEVALAEAQLGETRRGAARIDDFLAELGERGGAVTRGSLHEARVRIARMSGDAPTAELHFARVERWFRPTCNPALVARCERLRREVDAASERRAGSVGHMADLEPSATELVRRALRACNNAQQRFDAALEMLIDHTGASAGAIFAHEAGELVLQASLGDVDRDETDALLRVQIAKRGNGEAVTVSTSGSSNERRSELEARPQRDAERMHALVLAAPDGTSQRVIAGAVIAVADGALRAPPEALLTALAQALDEDVAVADRAGA